MGNYQFKLIGVLVAMTAILFFAQNCQKFKSVGLDDASINGLQTVTSPGASRLFSEEVGNVTVSDASARSSDSAAAIKDANSANCTESVLAGWKCQEVTVQSAEGKNYRIKMKWNRPLHQSRGTLFISHGGSGVGNSRNDPPTKYMMDLLDTQDAVRIVDLEFLDTGVSNDYNVLDSGYWKHFGGYKSSSAAWLAAFNWAKDNNLFVGDFLNYLGGSNGSMNVAYAMSHYGVDKYFDRVIFQMGPFLPSLANACNSSSASSFYLNDSEKVNFVFSLVNSWLYGDQSKNICQYFGGEDRMSILGPNTYFQNTHVHVIMGEQEKTAGFGPWILASNLEWFNAIRAKSKERIVRFEMQHNNSYKDMRRYAKLAPHQKPAEDTDCIDQVTSSCESDRIVEKNIRSCRQILQPSFEVNNNWQSCPEVCVAGNCSACWSRQTGVTCGSKLTQNLILQYSKTQNGSEASDFSVGEQLFGRVTDISGNAKSCVETNENVGYCDQLSNFTQMPNNDWSYNASTRTWNGLLTVTEPYSGKQFKSYWYDVSTQKKSAAVTFKVSALPRLIFSKNIDGPAAPQFSVGEVVYFRVTGIGTSAKSCIETNENSGFCSSLNNFTSMPNSDWSYDAASKIWRASLNVSSEWSGKTFKGYWYDNLTGVMTPASVMSVN